VLKGSALISLLGSPQLATPACLPGLACWLWVAPRTLKKRPLLLRAQWEAEARTPASASVAFNPRPVADAGGVQLPPSVHLTRASVSEAAAGLRASGTIRLGAAPKVSGGGLVTVIQ
jgi:hypothetical protein